MSERRNFVALESVFREIDETLKQARDALEAYVEDKDDAAQMRFCLSYLHQVHSTLKIVDFPGAIRFAAEIESLAEMLANGKTPDQAKGEDVLMGSMLRLPIYLNAIVAEREEPQRLLQSGLKELLLAKGEELQSEEEYFAPNIQQVNVSVEKSATMPQAEFDELVKKLRQVFQAAFVDIVRNKRWGPNLRSLAKVCQRLKKMSQGYAREPLWQISLAIIEGLVNRSISPSNAVKSLLKEIDKELKGLAENGIAQLDQPVSADLLRQLLYFIAKSDADSPLIKEVQEAYHLKEALAALGDHDEGQLDNTAMNQAIEVLLGEISLVKDVLDIFVRTGEGSAEKLAEAQPIYKRIADTLAVLGLPDITDSVKAQAVAFDAYVENGDFEDRVALVSIASELIRSEDLLQQHIAKGAAVTAGEDPHFAAARDQVVKEARDELERAKEAIVEFVASQWDANRLAPVVASLSEIRGGLEIVGLDRASRVVMAIYRYVSEQLVNANATQSWQNLDLLADSMSAVDYYLEQVNNDIRNIDSDSLDVAATSMAELGYPEDRLDEIPVPEVTEAADVEEAQTEPPASTADVVSFPTGKVEEDDADDLIDDEILEIFIEEVGEVLENIDERLPAWKADNDDGEAMLDVRRAFHTLKGSGRTVGANVIGELAWAVEDMLNEIRDGNTKVTEQHFAYLDKVILILPTLQDSFSQQDQESTQPLAAAYESAARAIKDSETVDLDALPQVGGAATEIENVALEETAVEEAEDTDGDDELLPIFLSETTAHLNTIAAFVTTAQQSAAHKPVTDELQRALHTLKGSTNMERFATIGEVVTPVEGLVKHIQIAQIPANNDVVAVLSQTTDFVRASVTKLEQNEALERLENADQFIAHVAALHAGFEQGSGGELIQDLAELMSVFSDRLFRLEDIHTSFNDGAATEQDAAEYGDHLNAMAVTAEEIKQPALTDITVKLRDAFIKGDSKLTDEFVTVGIKATNAITTMLDSMAAGLRVHPADDNLLTAIGGIATGAAAAVVIDGLLESAEDNTAQTFTVDSDDSEATVDVSETDITADDVVELDGEDLDVVTINAEEDLNVDVAEAERAEAERAEAERAEAERAEAERAEAERAEAERAEAERAEAERAEAERAEAERAEAERAEAERAEAERAEAERAEAERAEAERAEAQKAAEKRAAEQSMLGIAEKKAEAEQRAQIEREKREEAQRRLEQNNKEAAGLKAAAEKRAKEEAERQEAERLAEEERRVKLEQEETASSSAPAKYSVFTDMPASKTDEETDEDIKEIFLEEAQDILESIDETTHQWMADPVANNGMEQLLRDLHTLKGSARLTGLFSVGDVSHHFETYITKVEREKLPADAAFFASLQEFQDCLVKLVDAVVNDEPTAPIMAALSAATVEASSEDVIDADVASLVDVQSEVEQSTVDDVVTIEAETGEITDLPAAVDSVEPAEVAAAETETAKAVATPDKGPQELVKVSAGLLEDLVNLAGETSISRGRVEERVTDIVYSLDEMEMTLERMQEQLRRLDIETQAQILFRQEQVEQNDEEDFDPLEMDRYSALQQLSRSLIESSTDIQDVKLSIFDNTRDLETLLLQQSRINTDLQEGLMRSRMVPFSRLAPRLRRIVRQVSVELDKPVNLVMDNIEGEMDRTLLEKMLAPFEHMLRNAVDHGIENRTERAASGKNETGTIAIELAREGGEVVIRLSDDGKGLNIGAIKEKAIKAGLMSEGAELTDHEVQQFILEAGLSTATEVTQLSGRGVGMDVVHSEIKQLGGTVDIHSQMGTGTEFEIRLPFTVSVNRALMVQVAGDTYALPLNTIEGIARVSPFELEAYFQPDAPQFEYGGQGYDLRYMGSMLHMSSRPNLEGVTAPLPVVLVRSPDHAVAIQVDALLGSREVVVKTLGLQFNAVPGLAGATVTGDGSVIVILDLHSMIRAEAASVGTKFIESEQANVEEERNQLVMVVDDSVTVRKVASRFLERNGKDVLVAKDGVEAMAMLQDHKPDVMLLDIEMPRMDGFEVASRVKRSQGLKDIKIIMITSRTGEKHRERAMALGVDYYLGKPYQEAELLSLLEEIEEKEEA